MCLAVTHTGSTLLLRGGVLSPELTLRPGDGQWVIGGGLLLVDDALTREGCVLIHIIVFPQK